MISITPDKASGSWDCYNFAQTCTLPLVNPSLERSQAANVGSTNRDTANSLGSAAVLALQRPSSGLDISQVAQASPYCSKRGLSSLRQQILGLQTEKLLTASLQQQFWRCSGRLAGSTSLRWWQASLYNSKRGLGSLRQQFLGL